MDNRIIVFILALSTMSPSNAQQDSALGQTQELLTSPTQRNELFQKDSNARETDQKLNLLTGSSDISNEIYKLSASIFKIIHDKANGNPEIMQKLLAEAAKNPESLGENLTPEQKSKLREIAKSIENQNKSRP